MLIKVNDIRYKLEDVTQEFLRENYFNIESVSHVPIISSSYIKHFNQVYENYKDYPELFRKKLMMKFSSDKNEALLFGDMLHEALETNGESLSNIAFLENRKNVKYVYEGEEYTLTKNHMILLQDVFRNNNPSTNFEVFTKSYFELYDEVNKKQLKKAYLAYGKTFNEFIEELIKYKDWTTKYVKSLDVSDKVKQDAITMVKAYKSYVYIKDLFKKLMRGGQQYLKSLHVNKGKRILDNEYGTKNKKLIANPQEFYYNLQACYNNLIDNDKVLNILFDKDFTKTLLELVVIWQYKGIQCKSMLDKVMINEEDKVVRIVDYKTFYGKSMNDFLGNYEKYKYNLSMSFYTEAVKSYLKLDDEWTVECVLIGINKTLQLSKVFFVSESDIELSKKDHVFMSEPHKYISDTTNQEYIVATKLAPNNVFNYNTGWYRSMNNIYKSFNNML